jgi:hypothetical protein
MPKKTAEKPTKTKPSNASSAKPRQVKDPRYRSFHFQKRIKHPRPPIVGTFKILRRALGLLWRNKFVFLGIIVVYGLLNMVFVQGFSSGSDVAGIKTSISQVAQGNVSSLGSGLTTFGYLLSNSGNTTNNTASSYQALLTIVISLVLIWTLRQVFGGSRVRVRDSFYRGVYPLIQFILVLAVVALQLIPLVVGVMLYNLVSSNGTIVGPLEHILWVAFAGFMALWSLYMITSSIFALYIVCLPDMTPLGALRSARELVRFRRWAVLRKIIAFLIILLIVAAIIVVPFIVYLPVVAGWLFFVLTMFGLVTVHSYMYSLYRELLQ